jgi:hypothetical protein
MVPYDGGVTFHLNGKTLLEAIYAVGGLEARFARDSGVESHFVLTGANDARGYSLTGRGTISIHAMDVLQTAPGLLVG